MKRKISDDDNLDDIKRFKLQLNEHLISSNDYLNRTSQLNEKITQIDDLLFETVDQNDNNNASNIETLFENCVTVLKYLHSLNSRCVFLLENKYDYNEIQEKKLDALQTLDLERYKLLSDANLLLPAEKKFNFYITRINLTIVKDISGDYKKKQYDQDGNLIISIKLEKSLTFDQWNTSRVLHKINGPIDIFTNIIDYKHGSFNVDLQSESNWFNFSKEQVIEQKEERFIETTLYERFILVFWPKCTEFYALLSIDYKSAIDFLHEIIIINNKTDEKINKYIEDLIKTLIRIRYSNKQTINNDYISKMLQILKAIKDLKTTKQIISLIISNLTQEIIREIVNLFDIFEWNDLEQDIIELMSPVSLNNIYDNCSFVKYLLSVKQDEIALKCLMSAVLPILEKVTLFSESIDHHHQKSLKILYCLAETLVSFKNSEDLMLNYKNLINHLKNSSIFKQLIEEFIKYFNKLKHSKSIYDLFNLRFKMLTNALRNTPEFSNVMEGNIPGHKEVETFLRSNHSELIYTKFNDLKQAKEFHSRYNGLKRGYSIQIETNGKGKTTQCVIKKTNELYQIQLLNYKNLLTELKLIESYFKLFSFVNNNDFSNAIINY